MSATWVRECTHCVLIRDEFGPLEWPDGRPFTPTAAVKRGRQTRRRGARPPHPTSTAWWVVLSLLLLVALYLL